MTGPLEHPLVREAFLLNPLTQLLLSLLHAALDMCHVLFKSDAITHYDGTNRPAILDLYGCKNASARVDVVSSNLQEGRVLKSVA